MKVKKWPICIWFLDDDLHKSASFLTEKALLRSIDGCIGSMLSAYFYFTGVRSKKMYDYWFADERRAETMSRLFPNWPIKKKPSFAAYGRKESRWCRACKENYDYVSSYLSLLLNEFESRHGSICAERDNVASWLMLDMPKIDFPYAGIDKIVLPWKAIDPKFRRTCIVEWYRLQFIASFEDSDPFKAYANCPRDIPEFVVEHFNLNA